eukprot:3260737-Pleurochrysis_carterae.AAC.1
MVQHSAVLQAAMETASSADQQTRRPGPLAIGRSVDMSAHLLSLMRKRVAVCATACVRACVRGVRACVHTHVLLRAQCAECAVRQARVPATSSRTTITAWATTWTRSRRRL